ncbi:Tolloid-like protein 2 [Cricetulus griseus]|uniref:Tolloid-like protein 2 n=1 Tax=Cricetulus griseus TaxID=10029 RepID=G3GZU8_CRIGR|nr:Tolloid-like protein 2 [Cricetulus griseus]ERE79679.1 tolloid-like protein 2 [Cricetulus griseus]
MSQAAALGTLVLLLLPLPCGTGVPGDNSDVALDYWALEGEEGTEQQLHYHDPCKAAVFWGDIALEEEDLKLFHIDKAEDWTKPSTEEMGHGTGKYWPSD